MDDNIIMELIKEVKTDLIDIKKDQTSIKVEQAVQSLKLDTIDSKVDKLELSLKNHIESKSQLVELLESTNGKWVIGGVVGIVVICLGLFNPAVFGFLKTLVPFFAHS